MRGTRLGWVEVSAVSLCEMVSRMLASLPPVAFRWRCKVLPPRPSRPPLPACGKPRRLAAAGYSPPIECNVLRSMRSISLNVSPVRPKTEIAGTHITDARQV